MSKKLFSKVEALKMKTTSTIYINAIENQSHDELRIVSQAAGFYNIEIGLKSSQYGYFQKRKSSLKFYSSLITFIEDQQFLFNRIIFRYPFASEGLAKFSKFFYKQIVFEHNTKETEELNLMLAQKKFARFSLYPSAFFYWFEEKIWPFYLEHFISKRVLRNAYAGACVTTEIAKYEKKRLPAYRTFVSSNFYEVGKVDISPIQYDANLQILSLGMIVSTPAVWYGLDRLLASFALCQSHFRLVLAGLDANTPYLLDLIQHYKIEKNLVLLGKLSSNELHHFYHQVHICFGSLGLYKINLRAASTLKVKESVAYGIPVVLAYQEEDFFSNSEFSPYYLEIENNSALIDFEAIKRFAVNFYANPCNKLELREKALKYLDVNVKMEKLLTHIV